MIRPYRSEDLPELMAIGNRAWRPIYASLGAIYGEDLFRTLVPDPLTVKGEQIRTFCERSPDRMLVCERNGRIVGFLSMMAPSRGIGEIGNNAADPESGERGVGQELYQAAFEWFARQGCAYAQVTTGLDASHAPARRAYERAGFNIHRDDITYFKKL